MPAAARQQQQQLDLVPRGYLPPAARSQALEDEELAAHLRWLWQKDHMGQDMFLLGPPGPLRRWLALAYAEMQGREVEYVVLSRDTTESDLKQRREIRDGRAIFFDQAPVRAAAMGRLLILDGIEKAERNVLPTLNNLLENREMGLEDGGFIMSHKVFDQLVASGQHTAEELSSRGLRRCHEDFRVIALGVPVPPFHGRTLDPPLRSRFQCRVVDDGLSGRSLLLPPPLPLPWLSALAAEGPTPPGPSARAMAVYAETLRQADGSGGVALGLPPFPSWALQHATALLERFPGACTPMQALSRVYPYLYGPAVMSGPGLKKESVTAVVEAAQRAGLLGHSAVGGRRQDAVVVMEEKAGREGQVEVVLASGARHAARRGTRRRRSASEWGGGAEGGGWYFETEQTRAVLDAMLQEHVLGRDVAILGGKGSGKSMLAQLFADRLGYRVEVFPLYKDMTPRDLLQRRSTDEHGNTTWEDSPLLAGAREGRLVVLDGIDRLHPDTLATLQRLVHDREADLLDGTRLVRSGGGRGTIPAHPSFRIVALGLPPSECGAATWLTADVLPLFSWLHLPRMTPVQHAAAMAHLFPTLARTPLHATLAGLLAALEPHPTLSLSTRQVLHLCRRLVDMPPARAHAELPDLVREALMAPFLAGPTRQQIDDILDHIQPAAKERGSATPSSSSSPPAAAGASPLRLEIDEHTFRIGDVVTRRRVAERVELVPRPVFFENARHAVLLQRLLEDYVAGETAILLVGNQGVGKNKLVDRLLEGLNAEREYVQLHRDTSLHSLTVVPNLVDGKLVFEDSPLVKAVEHGRVLVVDEADKAPLEVVTLLKGLLQDGFMLLGDGRRLLSRVKVEAEEEEGGVGGGRGFVPIHPDFRMIVLANRPGFPFLGNDFFREAGDAFACHVIDNPDIDSEATLLAAYAPSVPDSIRRRLALCFADLRDLYARGLIQYPYSIREAVALIKHLEAFPEDGVVSALDNVVGFDRYNADLRATIADVFRRRGIPMARLSSAIPVQARVSLSEVQALPRPVLTGHWTLGPTTHKAVVRRESAKPKPWTPVRPSPASPYSLESSRTESFGEEVGRLNVLRHLGQRGDLVGMAVTGEGDVHVLSTGPLALHCFRDVDQGSGEVRKLELMSGPWAHYTGDEDPRVVSLEGGRRVGVVFPDRATLLLVDPNASSASSGSSQDRAPGASVAQALELPPADASTIRNRWVGWGSSSSRDASSSASTVEVVSDVSQGPRLLYYSPRSSALSLLDLDSRKATHYSFEGLSISRVSVSPSGHLLVWPTDGSTVPYLVDGLIYQHDSRGLQATSPPDVSLRQLQATPNSAPAVPPPSSLLVSGFQSQADTSPSSSSSSALYLSRSDLHYQRVHPWSPSAPTPMAVHDLPRPAASPITDVSQARALRRLGHLASVLSPHPSSSSESQGPVVEVSEPASQSWRAIPLAKPAASSKEEDEEEAAGEEDGARLRARLRRAREVKVVGMEELGSRLAVLTSDGWLRVLELQHESLRGGLSDWFRMQGRDEQGRRLMPKTRAPAGGSSRPKTGTSRPKHGKEDAKNDPHVGGNTWAGGTGGSDTAGLGGRGGPYRLDRGHTVHQVSDAMKAEVSEEAKREARRMAKERLQERLREIDMGEGEWAMYNDMLERVSPQVQQLRQMLEGLQSKSQERTWLRNQGIGELDDAKLVDGMAGERLVFRRRGEPTDQPLGPKPGRRKLLFVADVSGSMYRFNGEDGRLDRLCETTMMIMEAFQGFEHKFDYAITGHSGDSPKLPLVNFGQPPRTRKDRLAVLQRMVAHSQYCMSGDHTLEATQMAVQQMGDMARAGGDDDGHFVFIVSDCNLDRYGIDPRILGQWLVRDADVSAHMIMIASRGEEAESATAHMPVGRAHVCLQTSTLPVVLKNIFTAELLASPS